MMCSDFKARHLVISVWVLLSMGSCAPHKETNTERETRIFSAYLHKVFSVDLQNGGIYVVIPDHPCAGCMDDAIAIFKKYKNTGAKLIVTPPHVKYLDMHDDNIYLDSMGVVNRLDLPIQNASIIFVGKGSIENFVYTTPEQNTKIRGLIAKHLGAE